MGFKSYDRKYIQTNRQTNRDHYFINIDVDVDVDVDIQGYPQRMRLQRRLYGVYIVCFHIFTVPCNCKLVCFFVKSLNKPVDNYI